MNTAARRLRTVGGRVLIAGWLLGFTIPAHAQFSSPDPYKPYTYQYLNFVTPTYPVNLALPNQARLESLYAASNRPRYNTLSDLGGGLFQGGSPIADSVLDRRAEEAEALQLEGQFNAAPYKSRADQEYETNAALRDEYYFLAMRATDPRSRALYLERYQSLNRSVAQSLEGNRRGSRSSSKVDLTSAARARGSTRVSTVSAASAISTAARFSERRAPANAAGRSAGSPNAGPRPAAATPSEILNRSLERSRSRAGTPSATGGSPPTR